MKKIDLTKFKCDKWNNFNEVIEYVEDELLERYNNGLRYSFYERRQCAETLDMLNNFRFMVQEVADIEPLLEECSL